jgi:hypothetical protein
VTFFQKVIRNSWVMFVILTVLHVIGNSLEGNPLIEPVNIPLIIIFAVIAGWFIAMLSDTRR